MYDNGVSTARKQHESFSYQDLNWIARWTSNGKCRFIIFQWVVRFNLRTYIQYSCFLLNFFRVSNRINIESTIPRKLFKTSVQFCFFLTLKLLSFKIHSRDSEARFSAKVIVKKERKLAKALMESSFRYSLLTTHQLLCKKKIKKFPQLVRHSIAISGRERSLSSLICEE